MNVAIDHEGGLTLLRFSGKLDTLASPEAQTAVTNAVETAEQGVVIDMTNVSFVSSAGLRVMLIGAKTSKAAGKVFRLAGLNAAVSDVFRMTGFNRLIEIHDTMDAAKTAE